MAWKDYKQLTVWKRAMVLTNLCYELYAQLPTQEIDVLGAQLRRSAVAVPALIAEGNGRDLQREMYHYLLMARGAVYALETTLLLCVQRSFLREKQCAEALDLCDELTLMLTSLTLRQNRGVQKRYAESVLKEDEA